MSSNHAKNSQNVSRRRAAKPSANMYSDDTPASRFSDDEEYVLVSAQSYDDVPPFRPSLGSSSDLQYSEADHPRLSHEPLIPDSNQFSRYEPYYHQLPMDAARRPLTSNELNPTERAALVKQSRKLNKILGTTPHIAENMQSSSPRDAPNKRQRRGTLAGSDIMLDRSASMATLGSPPLEPPPGSQWSKPAGSSLVATSSSNANAKAPVLQLNVAPSSGHKMEPERTRRLSDSSVASSLLTMPSRHRSGSVRAISRRQDTTDGFDDSQEIPPSSENTKNDPLSNMYIPTSPTSPAYVSDATRRQQTRARMAKLQQIMGESVPSELVMGTSANNKIRRRRLSMESPTTPTSVVAAKSLKHKRSKSLWRKDIDDTLEFDSAPENSSGTKGHSKSKSRGMPPIEDLLLRQLQNPMNEKQKALNVKRALKMAAVFGVPPPQTLYQDIPGPGSHGSFDPSMSRQSLASLAYMLDHDRDSLYDLLANTAGSDSESEDEPVEWPYEHKPRTDSFPEARSKAPINAPIGAAKFSIAGTTPDMCPPTPPFGSHSHASSKPTSSRGPPLVYSTSVSTLGEGDDQNKKQQSASPRHKNPYSALDRQFASRRRRAKKLSQFFGVGYNDLFNTLVYEDGLGNRQDPALDHPLPPFPTGFSNTDTAAAAISDPPANRAAAPPSAYRATGRGGTVLVQTDNGKKATVLRTSANMAADVDATDLGEMMSRLRALRA